MEKGSPVPQLREMCQVSQGCRRHLAGEAQEMLVAPQLVLSMGCYLCATFPWEFYVGFRDYLWFQGKHEWRELRAWQLRFLCREIVSIHTSGSAGRSWSCFNENNSSKVKCIFLSGTWMCCFLGRIWQIMLSTCKGACTRVCQLSHTRTHRGKREKLSESKEKPIIHERVWVGDKSVPKRYRVMKLWRAGKCWYYFIIVYWRVLVSQCSKGCIQ